jgi:nitroreductase
MDMLPFLESARTCRRFYEDRPLSLQDVEWLVSCARVIPSTRNAQVLRFAVVGNGPTCEKLFPLTRWAGALKDWGGPFPGERPTGFVVILKPTDDAKTTWIDVGIAAQTIQLAAHSKGWGACIIITFDQTKVRELLSIPPELDPALVIGLGVAKEERKVAPMPADGSVTYWRDEKGVHYVPKRDLSELIVRRF